MEAPETLSAFTSTGPSRIICGHHLRYARRELLCTSGSAGRLIDVKGGHFMTDRQISHTDARSRHAFSPSSAEPASQDVLRSPSSVVYKVLPDCPNIYTTAPFVFSQFFLWFLRTLQIHPPKPISHSVMKFFAAFTSLFAFSTLALTDTIRYDTTYDNAGQSMNTVSCSDGPNGLVNKYPTFGSLPDFPNIGAAAAVGGWGSAACGTCWAITYNGVTVNIVAMDHADDGFNLSLEAMNTLTDGQAEFYGSVQATVQQVDKSQCGM
ncbi:hypothetical protein EVG20_g1124 [Dentipellis fragilis]|uniref:Cerato-platanin n=1 Tax=Dentipellis fragilis TaxID=205917 RepID=A0A4Y9ZBM7_9AGAM|nr:hypothetical protein EVG20_g1124 [Dentipellis fragilis]